MSQEEDIKNVLCYCTNLDSIISLLLSSQRDVYRIQLIDNYEDEPTNRLWELVEQLMDMGVREADALALADRFWAFPIRRRIINYEMRPVREFPTFPAFISFPSVSR